MDTGAWADAFPETQTVRLTGRSIFIIHDLNLQMDPVVCGIEVIVSGHSHVPKIETKRGVLYLNPGSAGRRRFRLPITLATLQVTSDRVLPTIHDLSDS